MLRLEDTLSLKVELHKELMEGFQELGRLRLVRLSLEETKGLVCRQGVTSPVL